MWMCPLNLSLSLRGKHGVGRIDIVENRFIGMKSRGKEVKCVCFIAFIPTGLVLCLNNDAASLSVFSYFSLYFYFTSFSKAFLSAGLSCNLLLFYMIALGVILCCLYKLEQGLFRKCFSLVHLESRRQSYFYSLVHSHTNIFCILQKTCSTGCFCLFIFGINRQLEKLLCYVSTCVTTVNIQAPAQHTHEYTHIHRLLCPCYTMCYDWQIDWPVGCGCGATWQVEIGKWEAHFSLPSAEQKIKTVSSSEAMQRGGAQGGRVVE